MELISQKILANYLKQKTVKTGFVNKVKIAYRPYICPFEDLLNNLPESSSVFDIGCGSGMFLSLVAKFKNPSKVAGIEIDEHLVENAKAVFNNKKSVPANFLVFDGKTIPNEISEYQYIYLIDVLHHVPKNQQSSFLQSVYQKMEKGATLVIKDINSASPLVYWNKFHDLLLASEIGNEPNAYSLKNQLTKFGFKVSEIEFKRMLLYPHFTIYCTK